MYVYICVCDDNNFKKQSWSWGGIGKTWEKLKGGKEGGRNDINRGLVKFSKNKY